jgi:SAM-dependent methyltransferase
VTRAEASVTGERVTTRAGGFNPTWQRHVAAYALCAELLPPGRVLDLGAGVGHSFELLRPRESVGVDIDAGALRGQARETVVADMRSLPFGDASFASVLSVHSLEHVPDPERVVEEAARVVDPDGVAIFVTPNRLTFGRPDEIIDPYHHVEFAADELQELCARSFGGVELRGPFGSERYLEIVAAERRKLDALLARDPLRLRRLVPRAVKRRLYDRRLTRERAGSDPRAAAIEPADFRLADGPLGEALDLVALCRNSGGQRAHDQSGANP